MKKLLSTTAALSLALVPVQPWPVLAQSTEVGAAIAEDGSILAADGTILCQVTTDTACDPSEFGIEDPALLGQALGEILQEDATPEADAAEESAPAEQAAEPAPAPDAAAEAPAEQAAEPVAEPAPEEPAEPAVEPTPEPAPEAAVEPAPEAAVEPAPEPAPEAAAEPEVAPAPEATAEPAPAEVAQPEAVTEPAPETTAEPAAETTAGTSAETEVMAEPLAPELEQIFEQAAEAEAEAVAEPAPEAVPVDVPVVSEEAAVSVEQLLTNAAPATEGAEDAQSAPAAAAATASTEGTTEATPAAEPQEVTETTITAADTRSSFEEFAAAPEVLDGGRKKSGLSDLEKAGLIALGAIVVGKILSDGREVVANTGDRVVVKEPDGGYQVYKDDDTLLRRPGSTVRTESYRDGSTRTTVTREDGSEVVTIRDATGRVLRRVLIDTRGRETVLIDDLVREERVDVSVLPEPRPAQMTISSRGEDAALRAEMARIEAQRLGRSFSLRQIREVKELRHLAAVIDVDNITFDTGSAVIRTTEARKLADLGRTIGDILENNPYEVFLIEGHTDAVGSAASNLALSDRRAESVALALTEYFGIPPENMVVQGYGEYDLRIATQSDERRNRRVAVRLISPLMETASR